MSEGNKKVVLVILVLAAAAIVGQPQMLWAYWYNVSGYVNYSSGGHPTYGFVEVTYTDPDGFVGRPGSVFIQSDGSYSWTFETIYRLDEIGSDMTLLAYQHNLVGMKIWQGGVAWTCQDMTETKNITMHLTVTRNPNMKVGTHVRYHDPKAGCNYGTIATCVDINTTEPSYNVDVFPVFFDLNAYLGCEYALCWPAWAYSAAFNNCTDLVIGSIVWPGDGASHTWLTCQPGPVAVPSFVWLYADTPGMICPCPHPVSGMISILDCAEGLDDPVCIFCAGVYGMIGDDPCAPTRTQPTNWGSIKAMFE